jgi:Uracil DNA glycosylase superfamily
LTRLTTDVLDELRRKMDEIITSYPPHIYKIEAPFVVGTAFFPGGCGLWCGLAPFAPAPQRFPETPVMFVGHNYAGAEAFRRLRAKGGEGGFWWRDIVLPLLLEAGIDPTQAFFTNALMGLKDGASLGSMNASRQFEAECALFLREQIEIVRPSVVIAFGGDAYSRVRAVDESAVKCVHPSAREFIPLGTRRQRVSERGAELRSALHGVGLS